MTLAIYVTIIQEQLDLLVKKHIHAVLTFGLFFDVLLQYYKFSIGAYFLSYEFVKILSRKFPLKEPRKF